MSYAVDTKVPVGRTKVEIEKLLNDHGCRQFAYAGNDERAAVQFMLSNRLVRFDLPLPQLDDYGLTPSGAMRSAEAKRAAHAKALRSRWRALLLCIKAKLEAFETGIESFDEAFMPHIVMPNGSRTAEHVLPAIRDAYETGRQPAFDRLMLTE